MRDPEPPALEGSEPVPATGSPTGDVQKSSPWRAGIEQSMAALAAALESAERLGLDTTAARAVQEDALARLRLPIDSFVVGFIGGTGVGKSSLLNALAGSDVSAAGARRPTTREPVAWVSRREIGLDELLHWLDVRRIVEGGEGGGRGGGGMLGAGFASAEAHDEADSLGLALLDLPDLDSIEESHRRRVDELLPKLDAVAWVVDPEKYGDALLHDGYVRRWSPRLGPQALVVNKRDLLDAKSLDAIRQDAERLLAADGAHMRVLAASAVGAGADGGERPLSVPAAGGPAGAAGSGAGPVRGVAPAAGVDELREWIAELAREKAAAAQRVRAAAGSVAASLAAQAGIGESGTFSPLIPADARRAAAAETQRRLASAIDLDRLERLASSATHRTALDAGGPFGTFRHLARAFGLGERPGMPVRDFLEGWRTRDSLLAASEPGAEAYRHAIETAPSGLRGMLARAGTPRAVSERLATVAESVPRAIPERELATPTARGWGTINTIRAAAVAAAIVALVWLVASAALRLPGSPGASLLVAAAIVAVLVAAGSRFVIAAYARIVGRRWGRRLAADVRKVLERESSVALFGPVDQAEAARGMLRRALLSGTQGEGPGRP